MMYLIAVYLGDIPGSQQVLLFMESILHCPGKQQGYFLVSMPMGFYLINIVYAGFYRKLCLGVDEFIIISHQPTTPFNLFSSGI